MRRTSSPDERDARHLLAHRRRPHRRLVQRVAVARHHVGHGDRSRAPSVSVTLQLLVVGRDHDDLMSAPCASESRNCPRASVLVRAISPLPSTQITTAPSSGVRVPRSISRALADGPGQLLRRQRRRRGRELLLHCKRILVGHLHRHRLAVVGGGRENGTARRRQRRLVEAVARRRQQLGLRHRPSAPTRSSITTTPPRPCARRLSGIRGLDLLVELGRHELRLGAARLRSTDDHKAGDAQPHGAPSLTSYRGISKWKT